MVLERNILAKRNSFLQYTIGRKVSTSVVKLLSFFLDLAKAFDCVPHEKLLVKLDFYGIRSQMHPWIKVILSNHTQNVPVNGTLPSPRPVVSRIPQDSVLVLCNFFCL